MNCPHCKSPLSTIDIDTVDGRVVKINECLNCGGHFLEPFLANFISANTAKNIDSVIPKSKQVSAISPICYKCGQPMSGIKDDAVPLTVTVFTCPNNHGDFFPKNQLLLFKQAQDAKINFHKIWGIPLKSAFAVVLPLLLVFTAIATIPTVIKQMSTPQETRIKASEIITQPLISPISPTHVLISFSTKNSVKTSLRFTEGMQKEIIVSDTPQTSHLISVEELQPSTIYKYVIVLDQDGKKVNTSEYTFSTP